MTDMKKTKQTDRDADVDDAVLRSSGVDYVYASGVQVFSNNWDLRMCFADRQPDNSLVPKIGVVMSHEHAKAFSELLQKQLKSVEEAFGPNRHIPS